MAPDSMCLAGRTIVVTGASSGIGRATARRLSELGAKVLLVARDEERLQETLGRLTGDGHDATVFDLMRVDEIPELLRRMAQERGPISGLFHGAGIYRAKPVRLLKGRDISSVFDINFTAAILLMRAFSQKGVASENGASAVLMSSVAAMRGESGLTAYSASKAAVDAAVRCLASELAPQRIRVNSVAAGAVRTGMLGRILAGQTPEGVERLERKHPLGFGSPEQVASAAAFLLSDASAWVTGTTLVVDGGYSCT